MDAAIQSWHSGFMGTTIGGIDVDMETEPTINDYVELFNRATLHHQAFAAIYNAITRDTIQWSDDPDRPIDQELYVFIELAIKYLMITGFLVWRSDPETGMEAAHPADVTITIGSDGHWSPLYRSTMTAPGAARTNAIEDGWQVLIMDSPEINFRMYTHVGVPDTAIRSAVAKAFTETHRVHAMQEHFLRRDMHNSRPAAWTSISASLSNSNGSTRPWFRGLGGNMTVDRQVDPEVSVVAPGFCLAIFSAAVLTAVFFFLWRAGRL